MNKRETTFKEAIQEAFEEEFEKTENLIMLGEDILDEKKQSLLGSIKKKFPKRIINYTPLVEDLLGGIALGMSLGGLKPVVQVDYETLLSLAFDDIHRWGHWRYRMALQSGPGIIFRVGMAESVHLGPDLSMSFLSAILSLPNIWIAIPSSPYYAKGLLKEALRLNQPIVFFESKSLYSKKEYIPVEDYTVSFGASSVLRSGKHISIVSWGLMAHTALRATEVLNRQGIDVEVIALHTLNPMDTDVLVNSAKKTGNMVILERGMLRGGIGAEISARLNESVPECRVKRIASRNVPPAPWEYSTYIIPQLEDIVLACVTLLER